MKTMVYEPIEPLWPAIRTASLSTGCLNGLLSALILGSIVTLQSWPILVELRQFAPLGVALVLGIGYGVPQAVVGLLLGLLLYRSNYGLVALLMYLPDNGLLLCHNSHP